MKNQAFTLIELLVVVLIIGILAAIAVPQYQLAVDKANYSKLMFLTKNIAEAQSLASQSGNLNPTFFDLDITVPSEDCSLTATTLSCPNKKLFCSLNNASNILMLPRCEAIDLQVSYYYIIRNGLVSTRICYAYTTNINDRANRLCQEMTGRKNSFDDNIYTSQGYKSSKGYYF